MLKTPSSIGILHSFFELFPAGQNLFKVSKITSEQHSLNVVLTLFCWLWAGFCRLGFIKKYDYDKCHVIKKMLPRFINVSSREQITENLDKLYEWNKLAVLKLFLNLIFKLKTWGTVTRISQELSFNFYLNIVFCWCHGINFCNLLITI